MQGALPVNMDGINAKNGLFAWSSILYPARYVGFRLWGCVACFVYSSYMNR